jgi:hypothetical protein
METILEENNRKILNQNYSAVLQETIMKTLDDGGIEDIIYQNIDLKIDEIKFIISFIQDHLDKISNILVEK